MINSSTQSQRMDYLYLYKSHELLAISFAKQRLKLNFKIAFTLQSVTMNCSQNYLKCPHLHSFILQLHIDIFHYEVNSK